MNRLIAALSAYVVIALLAWFTLAGDKLKFGSAFEASPRDLVVTLMAVFAVLTVFNHWKERMRARLEQDDRRE